MTKMNQLCKVCEEPAAGFHFGAFTCEGCKSFFGRTHNNLSSIQECKNNGQCVIDKKNRTSCKACRLRKCLLVGMSKSGSRYGRRSNWFKIHCLLQEQSNMKSSFDGAFRQTFVPTSKSMERVDSPHSPSNGSHESLASEASDDNKSPVYNNTPMSHRVRPSFANGTRSILTPPPCVIGGGSGRGTPPAADVFLRPASAPHSSYPQSFLFPYANAWARFHNLLPSTPPTMESGSSREYTLQYAAHQDGPIDLSVKSVRLSESEPRQQKQQVAIDDELMLESPINSDESELEFDGSKEGDMCPLDREVTPLDLTKRSQGPRDYSL